MLTRREIRGQRQLPVDGESEARDTAEPERTTVRILFVCTGNVIRSALAERALRQQFAAIGAHGLNVSSAGTRAAVGQGMWRESVEIARAYGFDYRDFVARQLDDAVLSRVDYVIAAAREHRETVLLHRPDLVHRTFTFREFVRIIDATSRELDSVSGGDAAARWIDLAAWAHGHREAHRPVDPDDDDLVDPQGGDREALWTFERELIRGVASIVSAVAGTPDG